jgi:hypothetical protein
VVQALEEDFLTEEVGEEASLVAEEAVEDSKKMNC